MPILCEFIIERAPVRRVHSKDIFGSTSTSGDARNITMLGKCHLCVVRCQKLKVVKLAYRPYANMAAANYSAQA